MFFARGCAGKAPSRQLSRLRSNLAPTQRASFAFASARAAPSPVRAGPKRNVIPNLASVKPPQISRSLTQEATSSVSCRKIVPGRQDCAVQGALTLRLSDGKLGAVGVLHLGCCIRVFNWAMEVRGKSKSARISPYQKGLAFFVPVANVLSMMTIGMLGSWVLVRSVNLVTAIDLLKTAAGIRMRVSIRRPVPMFPQRHLVIAPYDLLLPRSAVRPAGVPTFAEMPQEGKGSKPLRFGTWVAKKISFTMWSFFSGNRKIFTHEGFLIANIQGQTAGLKIDIEGTFPNGVWNLVEVSTLAEE